VRLYHASKLGYFRGDFVVPANYYYPDRSEVIHFADTPERASQWVKNVAATWSLWCVNSKEIDGLEPNPAYAGAYVTRERQAADAFTLIETHNEERGEMASVENYIEGLI